MPVIKSPLNPHVAILLCAYKGEAYIIEQLDSIFAQTHKNISLWVSLDMDDPRASQDDLLLTLIKYRNDKNNNPDNPIKMTILVGPGKGYNENFLSLVCKQDIQADFFAYSDQDDIWNEDKISRALARLTEIDAGDESSVLYCSRTHLIDETGQNIGLSPLFKRPATFANALVQNVGGGNTMVFNRNARDILKAIETVDVVCYDWWTYLVISAVGGKVIYDPVPSLKYRQHARNTIGANLGWSARFSRIYLMLKGKFRQWNDINMASLEKLKNQISEDNCRVLEVFCGARKKLLFPRIWGMYKSGVYRQTIMGNVGLWVAILLKKV